jgi:Zn-dependent protease with chaperone function
MYTNFIYFIVVLLIFSTQQPALVPRFSPLLAFCGSAGLFLLFGVINRWIFKLLATRLSEETPSSYFALLYHRTVGKQSLLALLFFCTQVYLLDVKSHLLAIDLISASFTLQGLAALALFLIHFAIMWSFSYDCYRRITGTSHTRASMVIANLKFNAAIILPWFLISGCFDLLQLLPVGSLHDWLNTPLGQILFFALLITLFMLFAPPLVVSLWGCEPLPSGAKRSLIERFCREHKFQVREIVLWPSSAGVYLTAGVMGLHRSCRYLLVTDGLLNILDDNELSAVLAHEMGHVKEHHLLFYLLFLLGYLVLAYPVSILSSLFVLVSDLPLQPMTQPDSELVTLVSVLYTLPLLLLLILYFRFLFGFFIRNFERQADLFVFRVTGNPLALISALEKVAFHSGNTRDVPSWHHFSIKQRVDFLAAAESKPALQLLHRQKLRRALAGYLVGLTVVGVAGYLFFAGIWGVNLSQLLNLKILNSMVKLEPDNTNIHLLLGELHYRRNNTEKAVSHWERALELDPENPEIMNNLSWILATSQRELFFQPERALTLAQKAVTVSQKAHILDTLAEAYHVNGKHREALEAAEQSLAAASGDTSYYRKQVDRFREIVEGRGK